MTATHPVRRDRGTGSRSARLGGRIPGRSAAAAREIAGDPHAIPWTHADQVNAALLDFLRS